LSNRFWTAKPPVAIRFTIFSSLQSLRKTVTIMTKAASFVQRWIEDANGVKPL
jgi:hypothetical protein